MSTLQKNIHILAHSENPPLEALIPMLDELGYTHTITRTPFGEDLPDLNQTQGIIILGAAASVHDSDKLSWIETEMNWVQNAITAQKPIFGICFGCQMLAKLLGGDTFEGHHGREFSYTTVEVTNHDDFFDTETIAKLPVFQAHGNTYSLPPKAIQLLKGKTYYQQAAKFGEKIYGTQFHPEITAEIAGRWHRFGLENGRDYGPSFPSLEEHIRITEENQKPVHLWLKKFLERLFA